MPSVQDLIAQLGQGDQPTAFKAQKDLRELAARASSPGKEADRAQVAAALAAELVRMTPTGKTADGKEIPPKIVHSAWVRDKIARLLGFVVTPAELPALEQALADFNVREGALYALAFTHLPEATATLAKALDAVGPEFRVGVVNALSRKGTPDAQTVLRSAAKDGDPRVAIAAMEALANYPDPANDAHMVTASQCGCPTAASLANKARVRLAATLDKADRHGDAAKLYRAIAASKADEPQRVAAKIALNTSKR